MTFTARIFSFDES